MHNPLPDELSFINEYRLEKANLLGAKWLTNEFEEDVWRCRFGKSIISVDFAITLTNGSLLTQGSNAHLLQSIKRYLCAQTHPTIVGVTVLTDNTAKALLQRALHVLDHFLLRGSFVNARRSRFRQLSKNDIHHFIDTVSFGRSIKTNIYEPEQRIANFVRTVKVSATDIELARKREPAIFDTASCELPDGITEKQVEIARVWLFTKGFYTSGTGESVFRYTLSATRLLHYLIGKQVLSNLKFDNMELDYLSFAPRERFVRELHAISVQSGGEDDRAAAEYVQSYIKTLSVMEIEVNADHCLVADDALTALDEKEALKHGRLKSKGRFTTLPFAVANQSFGRAIEFYVKYGSDLIDYYLALAENDWQGDALTNIPASLQNLGVKKFENTKVIAEEYFNELRNGTSLYQMLQVLLGAIIVLVNTLMARRASELRGLTRDSIVQDGHYFFLAFNLGKANLGELRKRALRPLPALGAEALGLLVRLGERLNELRYESSPTLFQRFKLSNKANFIPYGTTKGETEWLRLCLDRFCDYIQIPPNADGCRYYIRPHQLRRNFAILFFWQGSFGGIEVLRYFLGHQKPSMTYRYVTESTKGSVLRRVKATLAAELIKVDSPATESLAEFICKRHGITMDDLHILPEADVVPYVEDLLASKEAEIEPEFIDGPNGEEYKILYNVCKLSSPAEVNNE